MHEITISTATTTTTANINDNNNNNHNGPRVVSPVDGAAPLPLPQQQPQPSLVDASPPPPPASHSLTERDMQTILASCDNNHHYHGLHDLAEYCLQNQHDKEPFLRAACASGLTGVARVLWQNSTGSTTTTLSSERGDDATLAERTVRAGCVIVSCVAVCARSKNFVQAAAGGGGGDSLLLQAVVQALHRFPHSTGIQRFGLVTVSRLLKSPSSAVSAGGGSCSLHLLEDPLVAALRQQTHSRKNNQDDDDDDLWIVLWACQCVKRLARYHRDAAAALTPPPPHVEVIRRLARRVQPLLHALCVRYDHRATENQNNCDLLAKILQEAWSALKHLPAL